MTRLLLLALPALLAACQNTQPGDTARATGQAAGEASPPKPAAAAPPAVEFGDPGMVRAAGTLAKFRWQLASAVDAKGQRIDALLVRPEQPITLRFQGGRVEVGNACKPASGGYGLGGKAVTIDKLVATGKPCADASLMALDREVGKRLGGKLGLRLSKGDARRLELTNAAGDVLVFAAATAAGTAGN